MKLLMTLNKGDFACAFVFKMNQSFFALSQERATNLRLWASQRLSVRHSADRQFSYQLDNQ